MTSLAKGRAPELLLKRDLDHYIGGRWHPAAGMERLDTFNPTTGQVAGTIARGGVADVDEAVASARSAFEGPWSLFKPAERQALLNRVHDLVDKNYDELVQLESADIGVPISRAMAMKPAILRSILHFAAQAGSGEGATIPNSIPGNTMTMTLKAPVGVVGAIIPWNGPLVSQWPILGAILATGCTCVLKPAEDASLTVLRTAELLMEAGLPAGVVNVVTGLGSEAGAALASHMDVDRIVFTGSTDTGREVIRASASNIKRIQLELGGKSPDVIFADADLDRAVPGAAMGVFANTGQICFAGTRVFVERSIQDEFVKRLVEFGRNVRVGHPLDASTQLGPIVSQKQLDRVLGYVDTGIAEGAELVLGGRRLAGDIRGGYFIEPTVFNNVSNQMTIAREEIFGPVVSVIPFDSIDEALALANETIYGLGGAVWSTNVKTVMRMVAGIKAGMVWVNTYGVTDLAVGYGGYKQSGYGWKGSTEGYLYEKSVYLNLD